jgi:hypothetical protein
MKNPHFTPKEVEEKCKNFILENTQAVLTTYKNESHEGRTTIVEFSAHAVNFPKVTIKVPDEIYDYLHTTKKYQIAISDGNQRAFTSHDVPLIGVLPSVDTSGQKKTLFITLEELRYVNKREGIEADVAFSTT